MNIQRGDNRQYFSNGVDKDFSSQFSGAIGQALNDGLQINQKANEAKLANYQIDLSSRFLQKNNEINLKYQSDPTNPDRDRELRESFDMLAGEYKVNPLSQAQWNNIKDNVYNRYKSYNAEWSIKQQTQNVQNDLKNGYEKLMNTVSMLGMNGAGIDEVRLVYANGIEGLRNGTIASLGEEYVSNALNDSTHDFMAKYLSSLSLNNPLEAQRLLKDEGVRNDIGRAETLQKLEDYVANSLSNQAKRTAVNELGNTLRNMNSDEADNLINGKADLSKVMKFVESNKSLPEGSKDLILNIYGITAKSDYFYDKDKMKIVKQEEKSRRQKNGLLALKNLSKTQKENIAIELEQELYDLFSFDSPQKVNPKKAVKNGEALEIQSNVLSNLQKVAQAQGAIDTAFNAGIISKQQRKDMMNKFVDPITNYLESNIQELDENSSFWGLGSKLGYDKIKKEFSIEGIPASHTNKIRERKKALLTAQGSYYSSLDMARKKLGLQSIYDIENLPADQQRIIYKQASENAIAYAKRYGEHPEVFFEKEYSQLYAQGVALFGIKDGRKIAKQVAKEIYNTPEGEKPDVKQAMSKAVNDMYSIKRDKAMMTKINLYEKYHVVQKPELIHTDFGTRKSKGYDEKLKMYNEQMTQRMKTLGVTEDYVRQKAKENRLTESQVLSMLEIYKYKQKTGKDFSTINYY